MNNTHPTLINRTCVDIMKQYMLFLLGLMDEKLKLMVVGVLCYLSCFLFIVDTFYVLSHPKIFWFRK